jgi:hypothetical protein
MKGKAPIDENGFFLSGKRTYPESIFMWWALKKKMVAGTKVMSK